MKNTREAYDELYLYTLEHGGASFMLQHVVDTFMAQTANDQTKPIGLTFALVGLYLHVEKQYSGKQVQRVHMTLARQERQWPTFRLPRSRGHMTAGDVLAVPAGPDRDLAIDTWCRSVWAAFHDSHQTVGELLREHKII